MKSVWDIEIQAPKERVWRALTTPGVLQPFYFNSRFDAELRPGGALTYSSPDGKHAFIHGVVLRLTPEAAFRPLFPILGPVGAGTARHL